MAEKLKLYSFYRSSATWRVRIALEWKHLDYQIIPVNILKGEQFSDDFKRLNPMTQVPALLIGNDELLTQSVSIMEYLDDAYPQEPLLPKDIVQKARVRQIVEIIVSGIQPLQNLSVILKFSTFFLNIAPSTYSIY